MAVLTELRWSQRKSDGRLDAEYYHPRYAKLEGGLAEYPCKTLDELGSVIDGIHASPDVVENDGVRYLSSQCVRDNGFLLSDTLLISRHQDALNKRTQLREKDIVLATMGEIGSTAVVTSDVLPANIDRSLGLIRLSLDVEIDPFFISTYLNTGVGRALALREATGNVQLHLFIEKIKRIRVPILPCAASVSSLAKSAYSKRREAEKRSAEAEGLFLSALGLEKLTSSPRLHYEQHFSELTTAHRFDAEYFSPRYQNVLNLLRESGITIGDVARLVEHRFNPILQKKGSTFFYIEIGNLAGNGEAQAQELDITNAPSRAQWILRRGDVITSTVRPIRRLSALISPAQDGYVCSSGFAALRPREGKDGIEPHVLLTYLRLPAICELLDLYATASMYPAIPTESLLHIPIVLPKQSIRDQIVAKVEASFTARWEADQLLSKAKNLVETAILKSDHLKDK